MAASLLVPGCATLTDAEAELQSVEMMKYSFKSSGQAGVRRLFRDETQAACSKPPGEELAKAVADKIEKTNLAAIQYPASGKLLGDWREGERIAQSGAGMRFDDDPDSPAGGNCYACHQLSRGEMSYGTIGPSLDNFGKARGQGVAIQRYAYGKIFNAQAYSACSSMPRFGHNKVLTPEQITHLVALLLDPASPVNQ
ncbi:MAG: sulfur oxidation c-type cytochrome SoxX [Betaproteobacteria bacterium]|nr:sulfur oxidation c-type cytochrome SoxX [Betaproteobacteria bacterium]